MNHNQMRSAIGAAIIAAMMSVLSQFSIPIGAIPVTLQTFVSALAGAVLGRKWGAAGVLLWVILGAVGVPVFANGHSGLGSILGPSGGYFWGLVLMAGISGFIAERPMPFWKQYSFAAAGLIADYVLGTAAFILYFRYGLGKEMTLATAMTVAVLPFIPFDLIKIGIAVSIGQKVRNVLKSAGYGPGRK